MTEHVELIMPDLGLGDLPVVASAWLVEPGKKVTVGDRLLELLAEGVTVDLPAPASGRLLATLVEEEDQVAVGQRLAIIAAEAVASE